MTRKPLIGITAGVIVNANGQWAPAVYGQSYTYTDAVIRAGGVPVILPLSNKESVWNELYERCDGIVFAGGNDVDPAIYGETNTNSKDLSPQRDKQELALLQRCLENDKPVLAICRGMQLLNVAQGGTLYQDIATELPTATDHEVSSHQESMFHIAHQLRVVPSSPLARILGTQKIAANSHHHQAVKAVGKGLTVTAYAEDGVIEGLALPANRFVIAVQPHPESLEKAVEPAWRLLFTAFIESAATS